jgi:hypothetical protein
MVMRFDVLRNRIDRGSVIVEDRPAVRAPRLATGIIGQRLATTDTARPADRFGAMQAVTRLRSQGLL